ncbi:MAG: hypothetical protein EAX95_09300 [Candidatus Thorarchaeota archaeon]|nr:hypothetical protein [Candidatus Thorarchaeota archaeon]
MAALVFSVLVMPVSLNFGFSNSGKVTTQTPLPFLISDVTWEDNCTSASLWTQQNNESGFATLDLIANEGALVSSAGYLSVTGLVGSGEEIEGPLFTRTIDPEVPIRNLSMFQVDLEFVYQFDEVGYLSLYLFDEFRDRIGMLQISDSDIASESKALCAFYRGGDSAVAGSFDSHYLFSWRASLSIRYEEDIRSVIAQIDDGTPNNQTLMVEGQFDEYREIKYIGIHACRDSRNYVGEHLRVHEIRLGYHKIITAGEGSLVTSPNPPFDGSPDNNSSPSHESNDVFPVELVGLVAGFAMVGFAMYAWPGRRKEIAEPFFRTSYDPSPRESRKSTSGLTSRSAPTPSVEEMLPGTFGEYSLGMNSWLCIHCGAPLGPILVENLRKGHTVQCDYCSRAITLQS